ncbi:glycosyltransferase family 2 protein [Parapedobacter tibetensis]|uniref:glycosyltransferase family 2 protein n=1 Tax=Parapedobacter tibetensis TaxID=2972951 RepID=UPI00214DB012|nr:glycosyltransferase family 2 protein [Parapedobacter tibetensis]
MSEHSEKSRLPAVSVLMPAYNAEAFIRQSIQSVLDQPFQDFELIIYNDGSTDTTACKVWQFLDPRIQFIDNKQNQGLTHARQATLELATGRYVAILDSDDVSFPDRLEKQYRFLERHPEVILCGGNALLMDAEGRTSGELLHQAYRQEELKIRFFFNNIFVNSSVMFRRAEAVQLGGYRDRAPVEDYDLFVRLADQDAIHVFNEPLVYYRTHEGNISQSKRDTAIFQLRRIKDDQLRLLRVDPQQYGAIFDALLWWRVAEHSLQDFYTMLVALKDANRRSRKLPIRLFERELYTRWYDLVLATTPKKQAAAYLLKKGLFSVFYLTFKQARRIVKLWLRSFF